MLIKLLYIFSILFMDGGFSKNGNRIQLEDVLFNTKSADDFLNSNCKELNKSSPIYPLAANHYKEDCKDCSFYGIKVNQLYAYKAEKGFAFFLLIEKTSDLKAILSKNANKVYDASFSVAQLIDSSSFACWQKDDVKIYQSEPFHRAALKNFQLLTITTLDYKHLFIFENTEETF